MALRRIVQTSEIVLPAHATIRRLPPRDPEAMQGDYLELFDSQTVACDVFNSLGRVILVGPPLLNLESRFLEARYRVDGQDVGPPSSHPLDRAQRLELVGFPVGDTLAVDYHPEHSASVVIRSDQNTLFEGLDVLVAMQRNNELHWIRDWAEFNIVVNKVEGIILYDMMSTDYSAQDVIDVLDGLPGLKSLVVVEWPYKYGAQPSRPGERWDSDFGQYVAWEHCRYRFLQQAHAVTIADLDELFLARDGRSVFEHAAESPTGVVRFNQRFIEAASTHPRSDKTASYQDYVHYLPEKPVGTTKWAAILDRLTERNQLHVHTVRRVYTDITDEILGRQYLPMKLNWQRRNFERRFPDVSLTSDHVLDTELAEAFERVRTHRRRHDDVA